MTSKVVAGIVLLMVLLVQSVIPYSWTFGVSNSVRLWILIKRRPFIYIILNFIIVSILISSSFTLHLNNLLLKLQTKIPHNNNNNTISSLLSQSSRKLLFSSDDDTWWCQIVRNEDTEHFIQLNEPHVQSDKDEKTASFKPQGAEKTEEVEVEVEEEWQRSEEKNSNDDDDDDDDDDHVGRNVEGEEVEEDDTMDATWKAIMDAKNKGSGPQLKKCGTWTSGDRGSGGGEVEKVGDKNMGRLARYNAGLKKWNTFNREVVVKEKNGNGGCLTYHDELKKRSDAFIARFNHDMRLQRLESDQRLLEMINRGL